MGNRNRSNVLLVEILIVVFFFMISATVVIQMFVTSRNMTVRAGVETAALAEAQNVVDALSAAKSPEATLKQLGFKQSHGIWTRRSDGYTLCVESSETPATAGTLWQAEVRALYGPLQEEEGRQEGDELLSLPCAHYKGGKT